MDDLTKAIICLEAHFADKNERLQTAWHVVVADLEARREKLTHGHIHAKVKELHEDLKE